MPTTITHVTVKNFDTWREVFDELYDVRQEFGCYEERIWHNVDDRNKVTILMEWDDAEGPRGYMESPEFKAISPERAGWVGQPVSYILADAD
ncbi:MAG TPA: antibiotic biosynthesis monooxygenase [Aggregatilineales bacterium]|nr:antibiotic biosynthesis monooxygenase [Aggregatilineales bacterium]